MLVNLNTIIKDATKHNYAVPAFTCPDMFFADAIISAAETINAPVIFGQAEAWDQYGPMDKFGRFYAKLAEEASIPVCLHLDHGFTQEYIKKAIDAGYTSVMADYSMLPFDENVEQVCAAVEMAHTAGASVEAMCGKMPSVYEMRDNPNLDIREYFTDPDELARFVEMTRADAMAVSFGTVHNMQISKPMLDLDLLKRLHDATDAALVLHGSSGVTDQQLLSVIPLGVRKINAYTKMSISAQPEIQRVISESSDKLFYHEIEVTARKAVQKVITDTLKLFGNGYDTSGRDWTDLEIVTF